MTTQDLTSWFALGNNAVTVLLKDECGSTESSSLIFLDALTFGQ